LAQDISHRDSHREFPSLERFAEGRAPARLLALTLGVILADEERESRQRLVEFPDPLGDVVEQLDSVRQLEARRPRTVEDVDLAPPRAEDDDQEALAPLRIHEPLLGFLLKF